jgi:uncharacterized protein
MVWLRCQLEDWWHFCYLIDMRIVVDTNVLVGACNGTGGTGAAARVMRACIAQRCTALIGNALMSEYDDVFRRPEVFKRCPLDEDDRLTMLEAFVINCQWVRVYYTWRPNLRDESDNHLVELAVAGGADAIVTRNLRDLKSMELRFPRLRVLSPEEFLKEI